MLQVICCSRFTIVAICIVTRVMFAGAAFAECAGACGGGVVGARAEYGGAFGDVGMYHVHSAIVAAFVSASDKLLSLEKISRYMRPADIKAQDINLIVTGVS